MHKDDFKLTNEVRKQINDSFDRRDRAEAAGSSFGGRRTIPPHQSRRSMQPYRTDSVKPYNDGTFDDEDDCDEQPPRGRKKHRFLKWGIWTAVVCIIIIFINIIFLYFRGQLWFNEPRKRDYPVRGAVVDERLGKIDWDKMAGQNISFVYIRATKGTTENDERYSFNRKAANHTDLMAGYYHEFDFRTDGEKQAEHFIDKLGSLDGKLRPMVKITRYGLYRVYMKNEEKVCEQLEKFLDRIKSEYGRRCVIQCDKDCYEKYIRGRFDDHTLWLISHYSEPDSEQTDWALWDYNPRVRAAAYSNKEEYYCMSVYRRGKSVANFKKNFLMG